MRERTDGRFSGSMLGLVEVVCCSLRGLVGRKLEEKMVMYFWVYLLSVLHVVVCRCIRLLHELKLNIRTAMDDLRRWNWRMPEVMSTCCYVWISDLLFLSFARGYFISVWLGEQWKTVWPVSLLISRQKYSIGVGR